MSTIEHNVTTTDSTSPISNALAPLTRGLISTFLAFFARPIRLFRPVKISGFTGLSALARTERTEFNLKFLKKLWIREGLKMLPKHFAFPFVANTLSGYVLFTTFSSTERFLLQNTASPSISMIIAVPWCSGLMAGAAQSIVSAPLDNLSVLSTKGFQSWTNLFWTTISETDAKGRRVVRFNLVKKGWQNFHLSLTKDSLAFAGFFLIFDLGRRGAKIIATTFDSISFTPGSRPSAAIKELKPKGIIKIDSTRTKTSLILQSFLILIAGGTAGWAHSQFSLPLDKLRQNPSQSIAEVLKPSSPLLRMNPSRLSHLPYQRGPGRTERMGRVISNGIVRGIRLVPIYSIGFLVFAVVGGDLE